MRKIILYSAVSLDGFVARENGDVDWLHDPELMLEGEDFGYAEFYDSVDATLMGGNTFRQIIGFDVPFPYSGKNNFVFSRDIMLQHPECTFVHGNIISYVKKLKEGEGKDIWLVGGGQINALLLDAHVIDEFILSVIPIVLGKGIPLFKEIASSHKFKLITSKAFSNGIVNNTFVSK